jgi:hypothetical protein
MEQDKIYEGFLGLRLADPRGRNTRWVGPYASAEEVKEGLRESFRENPNTGLETVGALYLWGKEYLVYAIANMSVGQFGDPLVEGGVIRIGKNLEFLKEGEFNTQSRLERAEQRTLEKMAVHPVKARSLPVYQPDESE